MLRWWFGWFFDLVGVSVDAEWRRTGTLEIFGRRRLFAVRVHDDEEERYWWYFGVLISCSCEFNGWCF